PGTIIVPPLLVRKPGRPRRNRRKAYDETISEKKARCCSICKPPGHNKTTCAGGAVGSNSRKRTRAEANGHTSQAQSSQAGSSGGTMPASKKPKKSTQE
ncbi:hypothetical protein MKW94_008313, partial [Papaver nudicaule]|nr:hypothetical protein [Papaver nudicaule]MCL7032896.1 hypothetical protein [Papaver nudicaule]MCL7046886.1 hypothetical protein [Papaver nudicaule]